MSAARSLSGATAKVSARHNRRAAAEAWEAAVGSWDLVVNTEALLQRALDKTERALYTTATP